MIRFSHLVLMFFAGILINGHAVGRKQRYEQEYID